MGIDELLESMRERLESRLSASGLHLVIDGPSDLRVRADHAAVEHILFNLIDNAAKYASVSEPPVVTITSAPVGDAVFLRICDHGPGIPSSEIRRIFRPFHKSAHEAAETKPGVGLGLALSRRLAQEQGGELRCLPRAQGACFELRLPGV
jgi:signal transduction histidine kinase